MSHSHKPNSNTRTNKSRTDKTQKIQKTQKAPTMANTADASNTKNATPPSFTEPPTTQNQPPCYIPLCLGSQSGHSHVLYYNANAPVDEIFDCATARLQAVIDLMENLFEYNTSEKTTLPAVATVSAYLLNDAMTLLQELNPLATQLRVNNSSSST